MLPAHLPPMCDWAVTLSSRFVPAVVRHCSVKAWISLKPTPNSAKTTGTRSSPAPMSRAGLALGLSSSGQGFPAWFQGSLWLRSGFGGPAWAAMGLKPFCARSHVAHPDRRVVPSGSWAMPGPAQGGCCTPGAGCASGVSIWGPWRGLGGPGPTQGLALLPGLTPIWLLFWAAVLYGSHCSVSGHLQRG